MKTGTILIIFYLMKYSIGFKFTKNLIYPFRSNYTKGQLFVQFNDEAKSRFTNLVTKSLDKFLVTPNVETILQKIKIKNEKIYNHINVVRENLKYLPNKINSAFSFSELVNDPLYVQNSNGLVLTMEEPLSSLIIDKNERMYVSTMSLMQAILESVDENGNLTFKKSAINLGIANLEADISHMSEILIDQINLLYSLPSSIPPTIYVAVRLLIKNNLNVDINKVKINLEFVNYQSLGGKDSLVFKYELYQQTYKKVQHPVNYNGISIGYQNTTFLERIDQILYSVSCTINNEFCFYQMLDANCTDSVKEHSFKRILDNCPFHIKHVAFPYEEFLEGIFVYNDTFIHRDGVQLEVKAPAFISSEKKFQISNAMKSETTLKFPFGKTSFHVEESDFTSEELLQLQNLNKKLETHQEDNFDITWHHFFRYLIFGGISLTSYNIFKLCGFLHQRYFRNFIMTLFQSCFYSVIQHNTEEQQNVQPSAPPLIIRPNRQNSMGTERRRNERMQNSSNRQLARALEMQSL